VSAKKNRNSNTLFLPPNEFLKRVEILKDEGIAEPELLLQVELGWEHLKVADSSKGWMAAYMLQAVPKNIFATLRCSRLTSL
jgi:hypothetical protein